VVETTRRREIEDVASSLFREHGYSGTSVRDIARALDIQGASLYAHVTSKQDVLWSIVERTASRFEASADAALTACSEPTDNHASRLAALARAHVDVVTDDIERASVFVHEWRALTGERRTQIARRRDAYELRFRSVITDGVAAGTFEVVDPTVTAAFILTSLNGISTWYRPDGRLRPSDVADAYADLVVHAVRAYGDGTDGAETDDDGTDGTR
jgi:TetR/AcrR family transcriptional regulator, cholesterol catabolism regulator